MVRARLASSGQFLELAGADNLTALRWVDPATTVPVADRNGMISQPFGTIQAAIDSLVGEAQAAIMLSPGDYAAAGAGWTDPAGERLILYGFGAVRNIGTVSSALAATLRLVGLGVADSRVALVALTDTTLELDQCFVAAVTAASSTVSSNECDFGGAVTVEGLTDYGSIFRGAVSTTAASLARETEFRDTFSGSTLIAWSSTFDGDVTCTGECLFNQCQAVVGSDVVADVIRCMGCLWANSLQATSAIQLIDTYMFVGTGPATVDAGAGQIEARGVRFAGDVTAASLIIDTVSRQAALAGGVTFVIAGAVQVSDAPLSATVSIVVPAVAADAVGYVNTTLVGTPLEGLFNTGDGVTVNPQSDLVAAGAGGGFINARIVAADSLRCAFNGALAGGAADFTVTRVR